MPPGASCRRLRARHAPQTSGPCCLPLHSSLFQSHIGTYRHSLFQNRLPHWPLLDRLAAPAATAQCGAGCCCESDSANVLTPPSPVMKRWSGSAGIFRGLSRATCTKGSSPRCAAKSSGVSERVLPAFTSARASHSATRNMKRLGKRFEQIDSKSDAESDKRLHQLPCHPVDLPDG